MSAFLLAKSSAGALLGFATIPASSSVEDIAAELILACGSGGSVGANAAPARIVLEEHGAERWARPVSAFGFAAVQSRHEARGVVARRRSA